MNTTDTIAALATPAGRGGIGIVRVSGPNVGRIITQLFRQAPRVGRINHRQFLDHDGSVIDDGVALYFRGPSSYTGEDVLELQGHGGRVIVDLLLARVLALGARSAAPGEFTQRAFLNDKMDLAQAEAVADLIDSQTVSAARSAQRSLQGAFSKHITNLLDSLIRARVWCEAAIDFPEEEIDFLKDRELVERLDALQDSIDTTLQQAKQGSLQREGLTLVIAGQPNVGKSSLLNRLAARDVAIVTDIPGTTRDLLREPIELNGIPLQVIDTAGLRQTHDPVELIGVAKAQEAIADADVVVLVTDDRVPWQTQSLNEVIEGRLLPIVVAHNKVDLSSGHIGRREKKDTHTHVGFSALTGAGFDILVATICESAGALPGTEVTFLARRRHLDALRRAAETVRNARQLMQDSQAGELVAEELRQGQNALSEITGAFGSHELLTEIFADFCIGK